MKINPQAAFATVQTGLDALDAALSQALQANDGLYKENLRLTDENKKKDGEIDLLKKRIAQLEGRPSETSVDQATRQAGQVPNEIPLPKKSKKRK